MAVWGKSLLSTHMLVGSSNSYVENACFVPHVCESLFFGAHKISRKGKLGLLQSIYTRKTVQQYGYNFSL